MIDTEPYWQAYSRRVVTAIGADQFCGCCERGFIYGSIIYVHLTAALVVAGVPIGLNVLPAVAPNFVFPSDAMYLSSAVPWFIGILPGIVLLAVGFRTVTAYDRHLENHYAGVNEAVEEFADEHDAEVKRI